MNATVLIVDDDPVQRRLAEAALTRDGMAVAACGDGTAALDHLAERRDGVSAMVLDLVMPGMDGIAVLEALRQRGDQVPVIVQTAKGSMDVAISAMRAGAFDFLVKPVAPAKLAKAVRDAVKVAESGQRRATPETFRKRAASRRQGVDLIGNGPEMTRVKRLIAKASASDIPVLIEGESGTGKELVARAIAGRGARATKPLVIVNCGAIPDNLVESILFGHEKGAFTGATEKHTGKFVEADGGTLFLDEIGELPNAAQVKLLRAIQDGHVEPVGARGGRTVDVRLVSATNRDLIAAVQPGRFREDHYYRLNVFPILTPSLRSRTGDLPELVDHLVERQARKAGLTGVPKVTDAAMEVLGAYDWPGNVRQLENELFRALVLSETGVLDAPDFAHIAAQLDGSRRPIAPMPALDRPLAPVAETPFPPAAPDGVPEPPPLRQQPAADRDHCVPLLGADDHARPLAAIEADAISHAVSHYDGQMSEIARRLGIGRSTLYRKLREYGIVGGRN